MYTQTSFVHKTTHPPITMRLTTTSILAACASLVSADYMQITSYNCRRLGDTGCSHTGAFFTSSSNYQINGNEGCRDWPGIPGVRQLCIDWTQRRSHFYFEGQAKRCMYISRFEDDFCRNTGVPGKECYWTRWTEVSCTW